MKSWGTFLRELAMSTSVTAIDRLLNDPESPVTPTKPKVPKVVKPRKAGNPKVSESKTRS